MLRIVLFIAFAFMSCKESPNSDRAPNIILILADDMGYSDIGCYGSEIRTPHLDRLAVGGARFGQFYNNARCCPSRAALLTGLYPHQAGIGAMTDTRIPIPEYQGFFNENAVTIAEALKKAGYKTLMSGKWHVGEENGHWPKDHGFDSSFALINGASSYFDFKPYRNELWPPGNELKVVSDDKILDMRDTRHYATDLYTDKAIELIVNHKKELPFFLYLSYTAPHWPLHALPEDILKYEGKYDEGWVAVRAKRFERLKKLKLIESETFLSEREPSERDWKSLTQKEKTHEARLMEVYAAMIDRLDQNIGKLMRVLEDNSYLENTVIIFLSDNGASVAGNLAGGKYSHPRFDREADPGTPTSFLGYGKSWANVSNTPFREFKSNIHEGGIATPFIVWYPAEITGGKIIHEPAHIVDVMPTLLDIGRGNYPQIVEGDSINPLEGTSLLPVLQREEPKLNRPLFFEHQGNCGLIRANWKIVKNHDQEWELYDLATDRSETKNLATAHPGKLEEMVLLYHNWAVKNKVLPYEEVQKAIPFKF